MTGLVSTLHHGRDIDNIPHFTGSEVFHISDIFDIAYLRDVFTARGRPAAVISDHVLELYDGRELAIEYFGFPFWAMRECRRWSAQDFDDDPDITCEYVFNFMVNRKQCSRFLLIRLVEIGAYNSYQYTWSGVGRSFDMNYIINELNQLERDHPLAGQDFRYEILKPIKIPERFLFAPNKSDSDNLVRRDCGYNFKKNWDLFARDLFMNSCVSLISESGNYDRLATITEKSLYAFFGLTFPIWIGNLGQAFACEKLGLDVFADVIDHSYQWYPTLIERCYWALELNRQILNDLSWAKTQRLRCRDRLLANLRFLLEGGLERHCDRQIAQLPKQYQNVAKKIMTEFSRP